MTWAALLDIDGTLIDSNDAHARAWVETLARFDYAVAFEQTRRLIGKGGDKLLPELTGVDSKSELGQRISKERTAYFLREYAPRLKPFPHARELLERLRADGFRLVTATSANAEELTPLLRVIGAEGMLYERTTSSDAKHSKPDPDIVQAALERAECPAERALFLGDTPYDVDAATKAGVPVVAVRAGGWNDAELTGARAIYDDVAELLARYESSPFHAKAAR